MKRFFYITVSIVFLSCAGNESVKTIGRDSALHDYANKVRRIILAGPDLENHETQVRDSLSAAFGFYYDHVSQTTPGETEGISTYNKVMDSLLVQVNGPDWENRFKHLLDSLK